MREAPLPRLFVAAGTRRGLWSLAALTLLSGAAMLPAMRTMADHGASLIAFESAGSVSRSQGDRHRVGLARARPQCGGSWRSTRRS